MYLYVYNIYNRKIYREKLPRIYVNIYMNIFIIVIIINIVIQLSF